MVERKSVHTITEVLAKLPQEGLPGRKNKKYLTDIDGDLINMNSFRYHVFAQSTVCPCCGLEDSFFAKERTAGTEERYHLNLYGVREGKEILFTKDHIVPKAKGGKNRMDNFQTMCAPCNRRKGANYGRLEERRTMLE